MKLEVNITKKRFFVILVAILIVGGVLLVIAYNSPMYKTSPDAGASYKTSVQAITFGHSADEMVVKMADGSLKTVQELLADGVGSSGGSAVSSSTFSRIEKSSETHCDIGGPWGWREEKSFCVVEGSVRLQGKCPSGTNKYGALGCYYLGCGDECCFYMCGVIRE